jgi:2-iminobutanoate/2-iminopropanoate deaminase
MAIKRWTPAEIGPPIGKYSHLASPGAGQPVYISGQVGLDREGKLAGSTLEAQTRAVFQNIETLLATAGARPAQIVKLLSFVVGPCDLSGFRRARDEVYERWFADGDWPAHSLAFVSGLARPDLLIEMEGVFAVEAIT